MRAAMQIINGVDLVDIRRLEQVIARHGERFLGRVFTLAERAEAGHLGSLAARFAAKEAAAKALGCGIGDVTWRELEVRRDDKRRPQLILYGTAQELAQKQGWVSWSLSLSHTAEQAVAVVTVLVEPPVLVEATTGQDDVHAP